MKKVLKFFVIFLILIIVCIFVYINKEINKYKVSTVEELSKFDSYDWNDMEKLNNLLELTHIKYISNKYTYIDKLLELKKYQKYFPVYEWYNSSDYYLFKLNMEMFTTDDIYSLSNLISSLSSYSFSDYGTDAYYIKDFDMLRKELIQNLSDFISGYNSNNVSKFNKAKNDTILTFNSLAEMEIKTIEICDEIDRKITNLNN